MTALLPCSHYLNQPENLCMPNRRGRPVMYSQECQDVSVCTECINFNWCANDHLCFETCHLFFPNHDMVLAQYSISLANSASSWLRGLGDGCQVVHFYWLHRFAMCVCILTSPPSHSQNLSHSLEEKSGIKTTSWTRNGGLG